MRQPRLVTERTVLARNEARLRELDRLATRLIDRGAVAVSGGGEPGPPGAPGAAGVSVTDADVNGSGNLILTLSTAATIDAGHVVGPQGIQGIQGIQGAAGTNGTNGSNGADGVGSVLARSRRTTPSADTSATTAATAQKITELQATLVSGRLYQISAQSVGMFGASGTAAALQLTYTTNGTTPDGSSPRLGWVQHATSGIVTPVDLVTHLAGAGAVTLKVLLSVYRASGTGVVNTWGAADWPVEVVIRDMGTGGTTPGGTQF